MFLALASIIVLSSSPGHGQNMEDKLRPYEGRAIGDVNIVNRNVFDDEMLLNPPFYYRWANSLHIVTREHVVRRELLFETGDTLNLRDIYETERNLRAAGFIGEIDFYAEPDSNGNINITVITTDLWTTKAEIYLDVAGGDYAVGLAFTEGNVLGLGKFIQLLGQVGSDQDGYAAAYIDNRLLGSRFAFDASLTKYTYSEGYSINITRPQYSLTVPFGVRASFASLDAVPRLFHRGVEIFRHNQDRRFLNAEAVYSLGLNRRLNLYGGYNLEKLDYSPEDSDHPLNVLIPGDEVISYPIVGVGGAIIEYDVERFLDASGTPEDLTLGGSLYYKFGRSDRVFGADFIGGWNQVSGRFLLRPFRRLFVGGGERLTWWLRDGHKERIRHQSQLAFFFKPASMHLLSVNAVTDFAWRQKATYQVILGGGNGLRGYSFYELAGDRLALGNLEYRFYTPLTILTVRLGAAAFFDIGHVWRRGQGVDLGDLKSGVGVGLRFGLTRSSTSRVVNFDFARALSQDDFFIGFGSTTPFSLRGLGFDD
jgi:hypothetical protein